MTKTPIPCNFLVCCPGKRERKKKEKNHAVEEKAKYPKVFLFPPSAP